MMGGRFLSFFPTFICSSAFILIAVSCAFTLLRAHNLLFFHVRSRRSQLTPVPRLDHERLQTLLATEAISLICWGRKKKTEESQRPLGIGLTRSDEPLIGLISRQLVCREQPMSKMSGVRWRSHTSHGEITAQRSETFFSTGFIWRVGIQNCRLAAVAAVAAYGLSGWQGAN